MAVELRCVEEGHTDKRWMLDVSGSSASLTTAAGEALVQFSHAEAQRRFKLPGLTDDRSQFAIVLDEQTIRFAVESAGMRQIEYFLQQPRPGSSSRTAAARHAERAVTQRNSDDDVRGSRAVAAAPPPPPPPPAPVAVPASQWSPASEREPMKILARPEAFPVFRPTLNVGPNDDIEPIERPGKRVSGRGRLLKVIFGMIAGASGMLQSMHFAKLRVAEDIDPQMFYSSLLAMVVGGVAALAFLFSAMRSSKPPVLSDQW